MTVVFCVFTAETDKAPAVEEEVKSLEEIYRERALMSMMEAKRKKGRVFPFQMATDLALLCLLLPSHIARLCVALSVLMDGQWHNCLSQSVSALLGNNYLQSDGHTSRIDEYQAGWCISMTTNLISKLFQGRFKKKQQ